MTITKVVSTRTKTLTRNVVFYSNGNHGEYWHVGNHLILRTPNGDISIENAGSVTVAALVPDLATGGFFGMDWINANAFQGRKKLDDGTKVCDYRGRFTTVNANLAFTAMTSAPGAVTPVMTMTLPAEAMIAVDSRLPLIVREPDRILTYTYQAAPTEMLQLPADMQQRMKSQQEREDYINRMKALEQQH